jgi:hypothetical protein
MSLLIPRKKFISLSFLGSAAFLTGKSVHPQQQQQGLAKPPALSAELVKEFVAKSHSDLDRVKELLKQEPGLLNCSWDWGGGDFESGLEAAGHMGRKDIAVLFLSNGARMNIFCAAMLGRLDIVKTILTAYPELKTSKGPHGLQLLHHAIQGGDDSVETLKYLESIGAA